MLVLPKTSRAGRHAQGRRSINLSQFAMTVCPSCSNERSRQCGGCSSILCWALVCVDIPNDLLLDSFYRTATAYELWREDVVEQSGGLWVVVVLVIPAFRHSPPVKLSSPDYAGVQATDGNQESSALLVRVSVRG